MVFWVGVLGKEGGVDGTKDVCLLFMIGQDINVEKLCRDAREDVMDG